ncbi:glycine zipper 2TM domain-containing protein [Massilia sp. H-1]|nr:glycine zipper 2TM domain-containing protein [Massilia sp. H-1]
MFNTKFVGAALIIAATAVSSTASASDRGVNTAVGAVVGAAIGSSTGSRNGALVGGVLGAAVGNSVRTDGRSRGYVDARVNYYDARYEDNRYYQPQPVYVEERYYELSTGLLPPCSALLRPISSGVR